MSTTKNQPWNDPRVTAYVLDELSPDERTSFEKEMAADDALAQAVIGAGEVTGQLSALFDAETTQPLTDSRRAAIINEPVIVRPEDEKTGRTALIAILAVAAAVLALIGFAPMLQTQQVAKVRETAASDTSIADKESIPAEMDASPVAKAMASQPYSDRIELDVADEAQKGQTGTVAMAKEDKKDNSVPVAIEFAAAPPAPLIKRSDLEKNRSRMQRSQLLESAPQSTSIPDIKVMPAPAEGVSDARTLAEKNPMTWEGRRRVPTLSKLPKVQSPSKRGREEMMMGGGDMGGGALGSDDSMMDLEMMDLGTGMSIGMRESVVLGVTPKIIIEEQEELAQTGFDPASSEGRGPGRGGDRFDRIIENDFIRTADHPLSTFSVDVDTASYSKVRDFLMRANQLPRPDAVRIEEMINYFDYADAPPADESDHPFAARVNITECPWNDGHRLARIAIKGKTMQPKERPACNLVFLLDTSGSMNAANKLPLVVEGMKMLTGQLTKNDKVAIVVYAGSAGLVLDSTPAKKKKKIRRALENLSAGGSTNGGQGIALAYQTAREHFIEGGVNRVILCTDGDFNVGTTGTDSLVRMVEKEAKDDVYLTVLGFGMGNHNDAMLEQISGRGNGNYAFIDNQREAHKVLVKQTAGTLVTIAKDVKLQVDFNPAKVGAYRLIGYENRILAKEDFNDDKKDAGEIGAGHSVTALYELVPPELAENLTRPAVDESKYAAKEKETKNDTGTSDESLKKESRSDETLTVRVRYKQPDSDTSTRVDFPATDAGQSFVDSSIDTRFTAAVAGFGMLLRSSEHSGVWELADVLKIAQSSLGDDESELRSEFVEIVKKAQQLKGQ